MDWIRDHVRRPKDADYAQRVLDRYRFGMRAHGAIQGVRIITGLDSCPTCQAVEGNVYHPDEAPISRSQDALTLKAAAVPTRQ